MIWVTIACPYIPSSAFEKVDKKRIPLLINELENSENKSKRKLEELVKSMGLELNDIILVKKEGWNSSSEEIGAIKEFRLDYNNSLEIIYNKIKINLEESKLPNVNTKIENVLYFFKLKEKTKLKDYKSKNSQIRDYKKDRKKYPLKLLLTMAISNYYFSPILKIRRIFSLVGTC